MIVVLPYYGIQIKRHSSTSFQRPEVQKHGSVPSDATQSAAMAQYVVCLSVRGPSVRNVHIGWNTLK